jgi:hypothetical protein
MGILSMSKDSALMSCVRGPLSRWRGERSAEGARRAEDAPPPRAGWRLPLAWPPEAAAPHDAPHGRWGHPMLLRDGFRRKHRAACRHTNCAAADDPSRAPTGFPPATRPDWPTGRRIRTAPDLEVPRGTAVEVTREAKACVKWLSPGGTRSDHRSNLP